MLRLDTLTHTLITSHTTSCVIPFQVLRRVAEGIQRIYDDRTIGQEEKGEGGGGTSPEKKGKGKKKAKGGEEGETEVEGTGGGVGGREVAGAFLETMSAHEIGSTVMRSLVRGVAIYVRFMARRGEVGREKEIERDRPCKKLDFDVV